jgi:flagellar biosynthesis/type III secretory pathway protein FliH
VTTLKKIFNFLLLGLLVIGFVAFSGCADKTVEETVNETTTTVNETITTANETVVPIVAETTTEVVNNTTKVVNETVTKIVNETTI